MIRDQNSEEKAAKRPIETHVITTCWLEAREGLVTSLAGRHASKVVQLYVVVVRSGCDTGSGMIQSESRNRLLLGRQERRVRESGEEDYGATQLQTTAERKEEQAFVCSFHLISCETGRKSSSGRSSRSSSSSSESGRVICSTE